MHRSQACSVRALSWILVVAGSSLLALSLLALTRPLRSRPLLTSAPTPPLTAPAMLERSHDFDMASGACVPGNATCSATSFRASLPTARGPGSVASPGDCDGIALVSLQHSSSTLLPVASMSQSACQPETGWLTRGVWLGHSARFAILDSARRSLLFYDHSGRSDGLLDHFGSLLLRENLPTGLLAMDSGYLALIRGTKLLWLDARFVPRREEQLKDLGIGAIYEWDGTRDQLVAYGALTTQTTGEQPRLGFLRAGFERNHGGEVRLKQPEMVLPLQDNRAYLLGHKNIAAARNRLFFLAVDDDAAIYEATDPPRRLKAFPPEYRRGGAPPVTSSRSDDAVAVYAALEEWTGPAGLYSDGDLLYLLTRRPAPPDNTYWELHIVDPDADKLLGTRSLPTVARHLLIVPGPEFWLLVEKGTVSSWGQQPVLSLLRLTPTQLSVNSSVKVQTSTVMRTKICMGEFRVRSP